MRFGIALAFVLLGCLPIGAQTTVSGTPAGTAFSGWLAAFNGGHATAYAAFVRKNWPDGVRYLKEDTDFRATTGGFDLRKVDAASTPTTFVALIQQRNSDQFWQVTLTVKAAEPHEIVDLVIGVRARPAEFALPHLSADALLTALTGRLQRDAAGDRFSGAVLVARDGKPVFEQAYGLADRERKQPNRTDTLFRIGSMNKMFTAVATMQLVQAGKLSLDGTVGAYLADYPNKEFASKVTVRELLAHTGGTGDIFGPAYDAHRLELRTLSDYVALYGKRAPAFDPGSRYAYSNYGFILLGAIVERVSGQSYYDYVRDHVYRPAGMASTGSEPEDRPVAGRSVGYTRAATGLRPNTNTLPYRGTSAGGGYTTVGDLLRFANALQEYRLLDAEHTQLLTTGSVPMPGGRKYGLGFAESTINGTRCFGHNGGAAGMNGDLEICPASRFVVAVLANRDPGAAQSISDFITNRLPQQ